MMDWSAHNAGFVLAAYLVSAFGLIAIAVGIILQDRKLAKALRNQKD
jgi:hypothetical protein